MDAKGKWIKIQAYKHNGELHREWSYGYCLDETDEYFIIVSVRSSVIESDGRKWRTKEPALFFLAKHKWLNVLAMMKKDGVGFYVNLASPTVYDGKYLKYIDYDLDVKMSSSGSVKLLDVNEFKRHSNEQHYGDEVKQILSTQLEEIYKMIKSKSYPFRPDEILNTFKKFKKEIYSR